MTPLASQAKIYPLMSGHNTICVATCLVECGLLPEDRRGSFLLEAPSGPVPIEADVADDGRCRSVTFDGPASFVGARDAVVGVRRGNTTYVVVSRRRRGGGRHDAVKWSRRRRGLDASNAP